MKDLLERLNLMANKGEDLNGLLARNLCYCLNEDPRNDHSHLFAGDHTLFLRSDADEQLLLHFTFNQTVKLTSISLGLPIDGSCPRTVKLFANKINLGFAEACGTNTNLHPMRP